MTVDTTHISSELACCWAEDGWGRGWGTRNMTSQILVVIDGGLGIVEAVLEG